MAHNVAHQLIREHLVSGAMDVGEEIGLRIDQTLTQDATGTMVMLELEALDLDRVKTEVSVQYADLTGCITLCLDCATLCACIPLLARGSESSAELCRVCADACEQRAQECERTGMTECAEACRKAAEACRQIAGAA